MDASVFDATGHAFDATDASALDATDEGALDASDADVVDAAGALDATDAGAVEHVVPDRVYDCDVVQVRCDMSCLTPQLASDGGALLSFEMTLTGNSVVIPPDYACTGTWYAAGTPEDVLGFNVAEGGSYNLGGFACQFPIGQVMYTCNGSYAACGASFVVLPSDPNPVRMNADGGAPQPGEIYVGLVNHNSYNAHCAPRR
jgi:hypothetical protein